MIATRVAVVLCLAGCLAGCTKRPPPERIFELEPNYRYTVGAQLEQGDVLYLRAWNLGHGARLRLHRCANDCADSTTIATWEKPDFANDAELRHTIDADGEYYFWVEDASARPSERAMMAEGPERTRNGFELVFAGRTKVLVVVDHGD